MANSNNNNKTNDNKIIEINLYLQRHGSTTFLFLGMSVPSSFREQLFPREN